MSTAMMPTFTPAMIFVDLAQYPSPPSTTATDECISAVLSSPSVSSFDDVYPAPPSTASSEHSALPLAASAVTAAVSMASTSCLPSSSSVPTPNAALTVSIPPPETSYFVDMATSQCAVPPLSAGTDGSFSSFSTASPGLPLYPTHAGLPSTSGCLYEAAAMSQAISPQSAFPAQYPYGPAPVSAFPAMMPVGEQGFVGGMGLGVAGGEVNFKFHPSKMAGPMGDFNGNASTTFSCGPTGLPTPNPESYEQSPMPSTTMSSFVGQLQPSPFGPNQIAAPEFMSYMPRTTSTLMPYPPSASPNLTQLPRAKDALPSASPNLNLYDATGIRNSGILFAPNGRILLACSFCKLRKLRCNGGTPGCSQCTKRGLCCSYPTTIRRRGKAKRKLASKSGASDAPSPSPSAIKEEEVDEADGAAHAAGADKQTSRSASEEPDVERSRKRKGTSFGSEPLLAPAYKKRSQSCHGTATSTSAA